MPLKIYALSGRKCIFQLCLLLLSLCCGNTLKAQYNPLSISGVNVDNSKIYQLGTEWIFDYQFIPAQDKPAEKNAINANDLNEIKNVVITVVKTSEHLKTMLGDNPPVLSFEHKCPPQILTHESAIIENDEEVWVHPPRDFFFKILQINPYPYIKKPFKKGLKWTWELKIGGRWGDKRWKEWTGNITNIASYEIVGDTLLPTKAGKIKCYIVQSSAKSEIGTTYLTSYFNPIFGFVKLDYTNIDGSKIILDFIEWKSKNTLYTINQLNN